MQPFFTSILTTTFGGQFAPKKGGQFDRIFQYRQALLPLVPPIQQAHSEKAATRLLHQFYQSLVCNMTTPQVFDVKTTDHKFSVLLPHEISFIEMNHNVLKITSLQPPTPATYLLREELHVIAQMLHGRGFMRVHKSYIINLNQPMLIDDEGELIFDDIGKAMVQENRIADVKLGLRMMKIRNTNPDKYDADTSWLNRTLLHVGK